MSSIPLTAHEVFGKPAPRFYLGAVILFWGWQSQQLGIAVAMAVLAESAAVWQKHIGMSWHITDKDFNRLADLSVILCVLTIFYFFNKQSVEGLFSVLGWLPALIFLLLLGQLYSTRQHLPLTALFWSLRIAKRQKSNPLLADNPLLHMRIDASYPYVVLCLLSASVFQQPYFLLGVFGFFAWGLYYSRSARYPLAIWLLALALAGAGGYAGQKGIQQLQRSLESWVLEWLDNQAWHSRDPYRQHTRIGDIGQLKLSNHILFRVKAREPLLVREASYDHYRQQRWHALKVDFQALPNPIETSGWILDNNPQHQQQAAQRLDVSLYLKQGSGMLPLPANSLSLHALSGLDIQRNQFDGAVKIDDAPSLLNYGVAYAQTPLPARLEQKRDVLLQIPEREQDTLEQLAQQLGLSDKQRSQAEKIRRLQDFFAQHFRYSLVQRDQPSFATPLTRFLLDTRQGHCEYFASSTVLLLRAAGIPSRYAVGFAVQEYSFLEDAYLVRRRHAHAWAQAYVDGRWIDIDTTPSDWGELEAEAASRWQLFADLWSWFKHGIDQWRWRDSSGDKQHLLWWLIPLVIVLLWRLSLHKKYRRKAKSSQDMPINIKKYGQDSPFYAVLEQLQARGYQQAPGQSLHHWLQQLQATPYFDTQHSAALAALTAQHNRYRFHPHRPTAQEKQQFQQAVDTWLSQAQ